MAVTAQKWAQDLLGALGDKNTAPNEQFIENWLPREGTKALNNPMATTLGSRASGVTVPGSTYFNPQGVQNYPTYQTGLQATKSTLEEPRYSAIAGALKSGDPYTYPNQSALESEFATWSGSGYTSVTSGTSPGYVSPGLAGSTSKGGITTSSKVTSGLSKTNSSGAKKPTTTGSWNPLKNLSPFKPAPTVGPSWLPWNWASDAANSAWSSALTVVFIIIALVLVAWGLKVTFERSGGGGGGGEPVILNEAEHVPVEAAA
jgi:hypothetical protein